MAFRPACIPLYTAYKEATWIIVQRVAIVQAVSGAVALCLANALQRTSFQRAKTYIAHPAWWIAACFALAGAAATTVAVATGPLGIIVPLESCTSLASAALLSWCFIAKDPNGVRTILRQSVGVALTVAGVTVAVVYGDHEDYCWTAEQIAGLFTASSNSTLLFVLLGAAILALWAVVRRAEHLLAEAVRRGDVRTAEARAAHAADVLQRAIHGVASSPAFDFSYVPSAIDSTTTNALVASDAEAQTIGNGDAPSRETGIVAAFSVSPIPVAEPGPGNLKQRSSSTPRRFRAGCGCGTSACVRVAQHARGPWFLNATPDTIPLHIPELWCVHIQHAATTHMRSSALSKSTPAPASAFPKEPWESIVVEGQAAMLPTARSVEQFQREMMGASSSVSSGESRMRRALGLTAMHGASRAAPAHSRAKTAAAISRHYEGSAVWVASATDEPPTRTGVAPVALDLKVDVGVAKAARRGDHARRKSIQAVALASDAVTHALAELSSEMQANFGPDAPVLDVPGHVRRLSNVSRTLEAPRHHLHHHCKTAAPVLELNATPAQAGIVDVATVRAQQTAGGDNVAERTCVQATPRLHTMRRQLWMHWRTLQRTTAEKNMVSAALESPPQAYTEWYSRLHPISLGLLSGAFTALLAVLIKLLGERRAGMQHVYAVMCVCAR